MSFVGSLFITSNKLFTLGNIIQVGDIKGKVLDTPGFSALDLTNYTNEEIKKSFIEFNKYKEAVNSAIKGRYFHISYPSKTRPKSR